MKTPFELRPPASFLLHYGPFAFNSELNLPELQHYPIRGESVVTLRVGDVPQSLEAAVFLGPQRQFAPGQFLLEIPGTGRFYVRDGREVLVEPAPDAPHSDLAIYLLGSVFGALCHQNGLLPLHASAVEAHGRVTAFLGDSGAGKSSLVALLAQRGHRIFADDICLLEPARDSLAAAPLAGWVKLWQETFDHLGLQPDARNRTFSNDDKYRLYLEPQDAHPRKVHQFCFLERAPEAVAEPRLEPVSPAAAISRMVQTIYPGYTPELRSEEQRLVRQCAQALTGARAFRLIVPWGWPHIHATLDLIERTLLQGP